MNKISKILYGFLSFTVFMAYKIEAAIAVTTKPVFVSERSLNGGSCDTYVDANGILKDLNYARGKYSGTANLEYETLCAEGNYLVGCWDGTTLVRYDTSQLSTLASICSADYARCGRCSGAGTVQQSYRQRKLKTTQFTVCDSYSYVTDSWGIEQKPGKDRLITYSIEIADDTGGFEVHPQTDCYIPAGTTGINTTSGTFVPSTNCMHK